MAGDGYAYVPYSFEVYIPGGGCVQTGKNYFRMLRVSSSGDFSWIASGGHKARRSTCARRGAHVTVDDFIAIAAPKFTRIQ